MNVNLQFVLMTANWVTLGYLPFTRVSCTNCLDVIPARFCNSERISWQ